MRNKNIVGNLVLIVGLLLVGSFVVGVDGPEWIRVVDLSEGVLERVKEVIWK